MTAFLPLTAFLPFMGKRRLCLHLIVGLSFLLLARPVPAEARAEDQTGQEKKAKAQNVGGLLFDVDEGVKIEQGPGGSVYLKSNRDYMQEKFSRIDERLDDLEERLTQLESQKKGKSSSAGASQEQKEGARQVLVS